MNTIGNAGIRKALENFQAQSQHKNAIDTSNKNAEKIIAAINKNELKPSEDPNRGKQLDVKA